MANVQSNIDSYLRHLTIERGMAKNTLLAYRRDLTRYHVFLVSHQIESANQITELLVRDFTQRLVTDKGMVATSVARILAAVRGFHKFMLFEGICENDVAAQVKPPKAPRRLPKAISVAEIERLLKASGPEPDDISGVGADLVRVRDRAILELLYATGARVSELVNIDLDDLIDPEIIRLFGKGSKERIVPVGSYAQNAVQAYLVRVRPSLARLAKGTPALFLNQRGSRLSRQSVWQIISDAAVAAGKSNLDKSLGRAVSKGKLTQEQSDEISAKVSFGEDFNLLANCDLVIEAAPEILTLKVEIFSKLDAAVKPTIAPDVSVSTDNKEPTNLSVPFVPILTELVAIVVGTQIV
jgi:integrase/recombinase XerD